MDKTIEAIGPITPGKGGGRSRGSRSIKRGGGEEGGTAPHGTGAPAAAAPAGNSAINALTKVMNSMGAPTAGGGKKRISISRGMQRNRSMGRNRSMQAARAGGRRRSRLLIIRG